MSLQDRAGAATPVPALASAPPAGGVHDAVAQEMAAVNQRLFGNHYFRAIDALVLLATFRLSAMLESMPWMAVFAAAAVGDGAVVRTIKSKEFRHHDPEQFALFLTLAILSACITVIVAVAPVSIPPWAMPVVPALLAVLLGQVVANFHRRA